MAKKAEGGALSQTGQETERESGRHPAPAAHEHRLALLGTLTAEIAHEMRNSIAAAVNAVEVARQELDQPTPLRNVAKDALADASEGLLRLARLTGDVKSFARAKPPTALVDLGNAVEVAVRLARPRVEQSARLVVAVESRLPVRGDENALVQVVLNLLLNAASALEDTGTSGHVVHVRLRADDRGRAVIAVQDDGPGMSPEVASQAFEPFFTTRLSGLGLGLSLSRRIVESHGGVIECSSSPGRTVFSVRLPRADRARAAGDDG